MMTRLLIYLFLIFGILLGAIYFILIPKTNILSAYAARMACTCHYVQNRTLEEVKAQELDFSFFKYVDLTLDAQKQQVTTTTFGLSPRKAFYKKGQGCILSKNEEKFNIEFTKPEITDSYQWNSSARLSNEQKSTIDQILYDENGADDKKTRACIIIYKDSIIYESYAPGFNKDMPQLGWSMSKSVTGALIGQMISEGMLSLDQTNLFKSWTGIKANISVQDLLHMKSGLEWEEDYTTVSPATTMLFDKNNIVDYNLTLGMEDSIGSHFEYSSGTSNLLFGLMKERLADEDLYLNYPYEKLFKPLQMSSAFIETDASGNYIGSSYMWATPRDWAKFGLLYLHKGYWDGKQVLDSAWVDYTFQSDPKSAGNYGTQFWHNDGNELPNSPRDLIYADGFQGQRVFIFPSEDLIIVRMGLNNIDFDNLNKTVIDFIHENPE